jgi:hypothetical protein
MTQAFPSRRRAAAAAIVVALTAWSGAARAQNPFKWLTHDKDTKYRTFKDAAGRFELEYPEKDWKLLPSGGSSLAVFARKDGPTLFVDYLRLADRLTPGEIDAMPDMEVGRLKERQPKATGFKTEVLDSHAGRGVLIRYNRAVAAPETVLQYTIPVGQDLFRLNGVVPDKELTKYEAVIMHMLQSFTAPAGAPGSKG